MVLLVEIIQLLIIKSGIPMAIALAATACPTPKPSLRAQTLYELLLGVLRVVLGFLDQVEEEGVEALGVAVDAKDAVGIYIILLSLK